jgi:hypothetical protein
MPPTVPDRVPVLAIRENATQAQAMLMKRKSSGRPFFFMDARSRWAWGLQCTSHAAVQVWPLIDGP